MSVNPSVTLHVAVGVGVAVGGTVAVAVGVGLGGTVAVAVGVGLGVPPTGAPFKSNGKSCGTSGAVAGLPASSTAAQTPVPTVNCMALSPAALRAPAIVLEGSKWTAAAVTVESQSSQ